MEKNGYRQKSVQSFGFFSSEQLFEYRWGIELLLLLFFAVLPLIDMVALQVRYASIIYCWQPLLVTSILLSSSVENCLCGVGHVFFAFCQLRKPFIEVSQYDPWYSWPRQDQISALVLVVDMLLKHNGWLLFTQLHADMDMVCNDEQKLIEKSRICIFSYTCWGDTDSPRILIAMYPIFPKQIRN